MNELEKYAAKRKLALALMQKEAFLRQAIKFGIQKAAPLIRGAKQRVGEGFYKVKNLPTRIRRRLDPKFAKQQDREMMKLRGGSGRFKIESPAELEKVRNYVAAGGLRQVPVSNVRRMYEGMGRMRDTGRANAQVLLPVKKPAPARKIPLGMRPGALGKADYTSAMKATRVNTAKSLTQALKKPASGAVVGAAAIKSKGK